MSKVIYQTKLLYPKLLWNRPVHFYKAQAGKVLVIAGSKGMTGAAILTSEAVFRSGTGILLLGFPEGLKNIYAEILPEAMTLALPETPSVSLAKKAEDIILENSKTCDVAVIGPGLSQNAETIHLIWQLIFELDIPIVLDADGLSALAKGIEVMRQKENVRFLKDFFKNKKAPLIITPHPGEAAKLLNAIKPEELEEKADNQYIDAHKEKIAEFLNQYLSAVVVVKGHDTVITDGKMTVVDKVGGPELATAGSGDVLAGVIGSFVGQNPRHVFEAVCTGVYLHSLSGKIAKDKVGERSVIASDVIRYLPEAIKQTEDEL
jgi:hydroxyethylthiazole kinase-like uncharacterized protein yjeF